VQNDEVLEQLRSLASPQGVEGMARYGIKPKNAYGVVVPRLRALAKEIGKDHVLAEQLWASGVHEARILASMIDIPRMVDEEQLERWAGDFDSWDICDQCCGNLFDRTAVAYQKAIEWSRRDQEFVKRAGFALMAYLAVHDKKRSDDAFEAFLPIIARESVDGRNFVKKAVNWALRQIGKRSKRLNEQAIATARAIQQIDSPAARWIAADALRELTSAKQQQRLEL
jgi:3-methyladenine DNA glycosylase AlkD